MKSCTHCGSLLTTRKQVKFCSNKCQIDYRHNQYLSLWKKGEVNGSKGIVAKGISGHIKHFLLKKFLNKCSICRWDKKHPVTNVIPLEIDHIDGDSENNSEDNLRLLCPNCHALTPFYKNLNKGKGRKWRMKKYI